MQAIGDMLGMDFAAVLAHADRFPLGELPRRAASAATNNVLAALYQLEAAVLHEAVERLMLEGGEPGWIAQVQDERSVCATLAMHYRGDDR